MAVLYHPTSFLAANTIFRSGTNLQRFHHSGRSTLSETGYTNDHIAFQWLQHFNTSTKSKVQQGQHWLLLFDCHGSHLTYEFIAYCHDNQIIPFCFIPKTTYFIQPLDGQVFQSYKFHYKTNNNHIAEWGGSTTDKADFLEQVPKAREDAFTKKTIRDLFAK
jgi:hypothetical protein